MIAKSAVLAWKFPVMNGIICEGDRIVKWDVPDHPIIPTDAEIAVWQPGWDANQAVIKSSTKIQKLE